VIPIIGMVVGISALAGMAAATEQPLGDFESFGVFAILIVALSVIVLVLTHAALTPIVVADSERRKATFGDALRKSFSRLLPLTALALVMGTAVTIGLFVATAPGLFLYCVWAVATPAMVEERLGIGGALGRSWELTDGERLKVFAIVLILCAIYVGIIVANAMVSVAFGVAGAAIGLAVQLIASMIAYAAIEIIWSGTLAALYVELVRIKGGGTVSTLEQVFA